VTEPELLAAVCAAPDDDAPRLVYADWLTERGDPRGEYIQLSCRAHRLPYYSEEFLELLDRLQGIESRHAAGWIAPLDGLTSGVLFSRGFAAHATLAIEHLERFAEIAARAPIVSVKIDDVDDEILRRLAASPHLARLQHVELAGQASADGFHALSSSPHLRPGVSLSCSFEVGPGARGLAGGRSANRIAKLSVAGDLDDDAIAAIARMPRLSAFTHLDGAACPGAGRALAAAPMLAEVVIGEGLGQEGALALTRSDSLRRIVLRGAGLTAAGAGELVRGLSPELRLLAISFDELGDEGARAIAGAPQLGRLIELELNYTGMTAAGLAAIVASPHLDALELLCAQGAPAEPLLALDDPALLPSLQMVRLRNHDLGGVASRSRSLHPGPWAGSLFRMRP
jgi:uncharacterized protein (TIGR02996 family)